MLFSPSPIHLTNGKASCNGKDNENSDHFPFMGNFPFMLQFFKTPEEETHHQKIQPYGRTNCKNPLHGAIIEVKGVQQTSGYPVGGK